MKQSTLIIFLAFLLLAIAVGCRPVTVQPITNPAVEQTPTLEPIATEQTTIEVGAPPASFFDLNPTAPTGSIFGWVWHDLCQSGLDGEPALTSAPDGCVESPSAIGNFRADGEQAPSEPPIAGLIVYLGAGECPSVGLAQTTTIATDISYAFNDLAAGTYCVSIDPSEATNLPLLRPGIWTYPEVSEGIIGQTVTLAAGGQRFDLNFGWDHQFLPQPLPTLTDEAYTGNGVPILTLEDNPFREVSFTLATELPSNPATAVIEQHTFPPMDETQARAIADRFGFTGPLYVQQIPAEFASPEGAPLIYTAFDGQRLLNISDSGLTYEDRSVALDFSQQLPVAERAARIEAQLQAWGLLTFPYELHQSEDGDVAIYRLINGQPTSQNEFNFILSQTGEMGYFDYQPLRAVTSLGHYPLQTAENAWQQLQSAEGRALSRFELLPHPNGEAFVPDYTTPRDWKPSDDQGQALHFYLSPFVFEATDGSGLLVQFGSLTVRADANTLADIAAHLPDVLHVWGTVGETDGDKFFALKGWEKVDGVRYETFEGTIRYEAGEALLETAENKIFVLAAAPDDLPENTAVYVNSTAQREEDAAYPILDWNSITEKISYPDVVITPQEEQPVIKSVTIDSVTLINFTLHQLNGGALTYPTLLFMPAWQFSGQTDAGQPITFWLSAVSSQ